MLRLEIYFDFHLNAFKIKIVQLTKHTHTKITYIVEIAVWREFEVLDKRTAVNVGVVVTRLRVNG